MQQRRAGLLIAAAAEEDALEGVAERAVVGLLHFERENLRRRPASWGEELKTERKLSGGPVN